MDMDRWDEDRARMYGDYEPNPIVDFFLSVVGIPVVVCSIALFGVIGTISLVSVFRSVSPYLGASIVIATVIAGIAFVFIKDVMPKAMVALLIAFGSIAFAIVGFLLYGAGVGAGSLCVTVFSLLLAMQDLKNAKLERPRYGWIVYVVGAYFAACVPIFMLSGVALMLANVFGVEVNLYWLFELSTFEIQD